ncbi:MAG: 30S ribosomal protein S18 [Deltaproteobacteria bacterium]|jgi:small subunit ribosomal protein S18|nr:30S ribosomal protein S18 [Deltaproteobacteria bacterium]
MAFNRRNDRDKKKGRKKKNIITRPRICRFCADRKIVIDYKDARILTPFITERGKIVPQRISGNCAKHQRAVNRAIKRARIIALVPYTATQTPMQ